MYNLFKKKNRREDVDSLGLMLMIIVFSIYSAGKSLIESGRWKNFVVFVVIGVIVYYVIKFIEKKRKEKPASLGKEFEYKYPVVTQYSPPQGLNPAEAGLLYNCKVDVTDLTSLIYQWAYEGLISIKNVNGKEGGKVIKKIQLTKLKDTESSRPFFEVEIFNSIFSAGPTKVIESSFQIRYALLLEDLEFHGIRKGWLYRETRGGVWKVVYRILLVMMYVSLYRFIRSIGDGNGGYFIPLILFLITLCGCIFLGGYMDGGTGLKLTDKGAKLASYVIGYRNFIKGCDENMLKLYLKNDPLFLDKTLPYATAFGLETEFLNKISPLAGDMKAQYSNGVKVTKGMKVIAFLFQYRRIGTRL